MKANPTSTTVNHQLLGWPSQATLGAYSGKIPLEDAYVCFTRLLAALSIRWVCSDNDSVSARPSKFSLCFSVRQLELK